MLNVTKIKNTNRFSAIHAAHDTSSNELRKQARQLDTTLYWSHHTEEPTSQHVLLLCNIQNMKIIHKLIISYVNCSEYNAQ